MALLPDAPNKLPSTVVRPRGVKHSQQELEQREVCPTCGLSRALYDDKDRAASKFVEACKDYGNYRKKVAEKIAYLEQRVFELELERRHSFYWLEQKVKRQRKEIARLIEKYEVKRIVDLHRTNEDQQQ